jgi:hypothetical protein
LNEISYGRSRYEEYKEMRSCLRKFSRVAYNTLQNRIKNLIEILSIILV